MTSTLIVMKRSAAVMGPSRPNRAPHWMPSRGVKGVAARMPAIERPLVSGAAPT